MTDWLHSVRTDGLPYIHYIALHCIALRCIALRYIALRTHCILTEQCTACLLLLPSVTFNWMYYLRSDLCFVCLSVTYFFSFFVWDLRTETGRLTVPATELKLNWNIVCPSIDISFWQKICCLSSDDMCSVHTDGSIAYRLKNKKKIKKWLTDFIPYGRTDFRIYLHCIALHCIALLHYITCCIACITFTCILTERNVSTACLLLNCAIGHV
jgi:hypothetical protein